MIYEPAEDSYLLENEVCKLSREKKVLDIGSGSGILAMAAKISGARSVLATDIDDESLTNLKRLGIKCVKSNLFSKLKGKKFDLIVFNPPYLPSDKREDEESARATTGGEKGDEIILRFLKDVKKHLNRQGVVLLLVSSLTPKERILEIIDKNKMRYNIISSQNIFMETLEVWEMTNL